MSPFRSCLLTASFWVVAGIWGCSGDSADTNMDSQPTGADSLTDGNATEDGRAGPSDSAQKDSIALDSYSTNPISLDSQVIEASTDTAKSDTYTLDTVTSDTVKLDSYTPDTSGSGYPLGNPAVPSGGCGKSLSTFSKGTNTLKMTSAGLAREYILSIPDNYAPNTPYRLVFGMHFMGGSDTAIRDGDWYSLKTLDKTGKTIWVAPQGYTDGAPWRGGDDKDHIFFDDMVKLFQSELCIDKSRVFSVGWSFGSMFTNSLAQTHEDVLRGVIVYSTADYNIYFPPNSGKPLAYMGVHGIWDGTCPLDAGRRSMQRFVSNNKCAVPASLPEAVYGGSHVCDDYQCPSNYPVKWCTFNGPHACVDTDPGQSSSWIAPESWKFISQF